MAYNCCDPLPKFKRLRYYFFDWWTLCVRIHVNPRSLWLIKSTHRLDLLRTYVFLSHRTKIQCNQIIHTTLSLRFRTIITYIHAISMCIYVVHAKWNVTITIIDMTCPYYGSDFFAERHSNANKIVFYTAIVICRRWKTIFTTLWFKKCLFLYSFP